MKQQTCSALALALMVSGGLAGSAVADSATEPDRRAYQQAIQAFGVDPKAAEQAARLATDEIERRARVDGMAGVVGATPVIALSDNPYALD